MHPLRLYADCLRRPSEGAHRARFSDGTVMALPLDRYLGPADATDERLLVDVPGPVLDVGCGPGRHLHALAARGVFALGVDLSPVAVDLARGGGARAIVASIFDELPGNGTWRSALLLDGNIGIGGAPARLLARIGTLLSDEGEVLVELDPPDTATAAGRARIETPRRVSSWFPWARVSAAGIGPVAREGGFEVAASWSLGERWFARLAR
jgi:SAM-dependent methyltransferase